MKKSTHIGTAVLASCIAAVPTSLSAKNPQTSRASVLISVTIPPRLNVVADERASAIEQDKRGSVSLPICVIGNSPEITYSLTLLPSGQTGTDSWSIGDAATLPFRVELSGGGVDNMLVPGAPVPGFQASTVGTCAARADRSARLMIRAAGSAKPLNAVTAPFTLLIAPD